MAQVVIVGDGPGGLSAALFLAKSGVDTTVFGADETAMHYAHLYNYLGVEDISGTDFQTVARRQVESFGATLRSQEVDEVAREDDRFVVHAGDETVDADYLILAGGKASQSVAAALGAGADGHVPVDGEQHTSVEGCYAVGRVVRPERSQAIISAGAGAVAALDILSRIADKDVHDWDTPGD